MGTHYDDGQLGLEGGEALENVPAVFGADIQIEQGNVDCIFGKTTQRLATIGRRHHFIIFTGQGLAERLPHRRVVIYD